MGQVLGCADDSDVKQGGASTTPASRKQPAEGDRNSATLNAPLQNGGKHKNSSKKQRQKLDNSLVFYEKQEEENFDLTKVNTDYQFQMVYFNTFDVFNEPFIVI